MCSILSKSFTSAVTMLAKPAASGIELFNASGGPRKLNNTIVINPPRMMAMMPKRRTNLSGLSCGTNLSSSFLTLDQAPQRAHDNLKSSFYLTLVIHPLFLESFRAFVVGLDH